MEELNFQELLDRFHKDGFTRGEKVILANFGTNQTLLSVIFDKPSRLQLVDQREDDGVINRAVNLFYGDTLCCHANTVILRARNRADVIYDITAGHLGLGQIVVTHNLPNRRVLLEVGRDRASFWRTYAIEGPEIYLKIHELFPRKPFLEVGWLEPEMKPNLNYYKSQGGKDEE